MDGTALGLGRGRGAGYMEYLVRGAGAGAGAGVEQRQGRPGTVRTGEHSYAMLNTVWAIQSTPLQGMFRSGTRVTWPSWVSASREIGACYKRTANPVAHAGTAAGIDSMLSHRTAVAVSYIYVLAIFDGDRGRTARMYSKGRGNRIDMKLSGGRLSLVGHQTGVVFVGSHLLVRKSVKFSIRSTAGLASFLFLRIGPM